MHGGIRPELSISMFLLVLLRAHSSSTSTPIIRCRVVRSPLYLVVVLVAISGVLWYCPGSLSYNRARKRLYYTQYIQSMYFVNNRSIIFFSDSRSEKKNERKPHFRHRLLQKRRLSRINYNFSIGDSTRRHSRNWQSRITRSRFPRKR